MTAAPVQTPPSLQDATARSTATWQSDLEALFHHAKDRFPDVVWHVVDDEEDNDKPVPEQVWGHKAVVYARAPPSFQNRYFTARPNALSPHPYSASPGGSLPLNSALSLPLSTVEYDASRSPSPFRSGSPSPSTNITNGVMQLTTSINPALFSNQLEYLYTGKGFGEAFEFLFDSTESHEDGDAEEQRIDKLRKDLVFMWRSRLYSDIRITLTGTFSSANHENSQAIFSTHRFILVSRSPYFYNALTSWGVQQSQGKASELTLPSPPFTPPALHFILGFIYTGTLVFSHRTYDLDTAFHILRCATYISLQTLYDEVQARIVQEMMHGLFHAFLEFSEYERITGGKWGTGGCRCRQCARRAPRILEFAILEDVKNPHLERGARRALVGLFGEGWCNSEFASLDQKHRDYVLRGLTKRMTPENIFPLLFASSHAISKLSPVIDAWGNVSREMIQSAIKNIEGVLCDQAEECFEQPDWLELMDQDEGVGFDDGEKVQLIMDSVKRGLSERNAPMVYQILVSSILLRPHPVEVDAAMLPATSHVRVQVEETRTEVLKWIGRRWLNIRQEGGFDNLEGWAIKEISHDIDVPVDDMYSPPEYKSGRSLKSEGQSDVASMHSLHSNVLRNNVNKRIVTPTKQQSSGASIRSVARSTMSTNTMRTTASRSTIGNLSRRPVTHKHVSRPDSKLTSPSQVSLPPSRPGSVEPDEKTTDKPVPKTLVPPATRQNSVASSKASTHSISTNGRPKSLAPSLSPSIKSNNTFRTTNNNLSTRRPRVSSAPRSPSLASNATSDTSTVYKTAGASSSGLRPPSSVSRTTSGASSDGTGTFKTASTALRSPVSRGRRLSSASTTSNSSFKSTGTATARAGFRSSAISTASTRSSANRAKKPVVTQPSGSKLSPVTKPKTPSLHSVRSTLSTRSSASKPSSPITKPALIPENEKKTPLAEASNTTPPARAVNMLKGKSKESDNASVGSSTASGLTVKRKGSADTITKRHPKKEAPSPAAAPTLLKGPLPTSTQGATLEIGIPCIISLKRKRFKAFARYIGEVEGELGPWVGVEVPMGEDMMDGKLDSRQWNDGTWGGIRYFDIGSAGSEWEFGDDRPSRRRRLDASTGNKSLKREGDTLNFDRHKRFRSVSPALSDASVTESRGLFVRPQNVLFVMGAD